MTTEILGYSSGWDTPNILQTPAQKSEMFMDTIGVVWPIFFVAIFFCLWANGSESRNRDKGWMQPCGIIGMIVFAVVFFWRLFV